MFKDRQEAGKILAGKLAQYKNKDAVVLALPRGGVVTAFEIAKDTGLPLEILPVRKIGHPDSPEYAICAVDESGERICEKSEEAAVDPRYLEEETKKQIAEAKRRAKVYRRERQKISLKGKMVILVDDGVATGLTMRLAVKVARKENPKKIIVAVPVAPVDSVEMLEGEADEVIILEDPKNFMGAVGAHYEFFEQVEDGEVVRLLKETSRIYDKKS